MRNYTTQMDAARRGIITPEMKAVDADIAKKDSPKGTMALTAYYGCRLVSKKAGGLLPRILSGIAAEVFMILGYFVFEGILYGFVASAVNIPMNAMQGAVGLMLGILLTRIFEKHKIM